MTKPNETAEVGGAESSLSVGEFIGAVNQTIGARFGHGVWVHGEIQEMKTPGHVYFTLVGQEDGKKVVLSASIWQGVYAKIRTELGMSGLQLADGLKVRVFGEPDLYPGNGRFSLKVSKIDSRFTLGDLIAQRAEAVQQLKQLGLYEANRKVAMAKLPLRIGMITSVGTAGYADVIKTFTDSEIGFSILIHDARVQGEEAISSITTAIGLLDARQDIDVLMLFRGGGSKNDLIVFDALPIAMAIANCRLPVFTGIGHETDFSIADEVAFSSHKTPTACAIAIIEVVENAIFCAEQAWSGIAEIAMNRLNLALVRLTRNTSEIRVKVLNAVADANKHLEVIAQLVNRRPIEVLQSARQALSAFADRTRLLDPVKIMARGWSIARDANGTVVTDIAKLKVGDNLITTMTNGSVTSTVQETKGK